MKQQKQPINYSNYNIKELREKEKAFQQIRKKQIEGMYFCIQTFNIARIVTVLLIIILIIFA